jgi:uncharacterized circularly permuted ATP-grasp superfamily protein
MKAYQSGHVALANAIGTGVADDKADLRFVPKMIKYYLDQEPILPNVPTYLGVDPKECEYILANLPELVVKAVNESGGYGMLMGPHSTKEEHREIPRAHPRRIRATTSPNRCLQLSRSSRVPGAITLKAATSICGPMCSTATAFKIVPGGLTRVALKKGSLVVNSSQGGGSKDTWVLRH